MSDKYVLRDKASLQQRFECFVIKAKQKHGDVYDYTMSLSDYKNTRSPIRIECKLCGLVFQTLPQDHVSKHPHRKGGCSNCVNGGNGLKKAIQVRWSNNHLSRINQYRMAAETKHKQGYVYPLLDQEYQNENSILTIQCVKCEHVFKSKARIHASMQRYGGCAVCNEAKKVKAISEKNRERQLHNYENKDLPVPVGYIYQLINNINAKTYIGFTTMSLKGRFKAHKDSASQVGKGYYKSNSYIHQAIRKYGIETFRIEALLTLHDVTPLQLAEQEVIYIKQLKPHYNQTQGGDMWGPTVTVSQPVNAYDLQGILRGSYRSLSYASKMTPGTTPSGIKLACQYHELYKNIRWEFVAK